MIGWNDDIVIARSAATCFALATDLKQCQRWIPQVQQIERLDHGPLRTGSRWRETRQEGKRRHTMDIEVFAHHSPADGAPPYIHCAGAELGRMKSYYRFIFTPIDTSNTQVRLEARVEPKQWWLGPPARVMVAIMKRSERQLLERLQYYCESSAQ